MNLLRFYMKKMALFYQCLKNIFARYRSLFWLFSPCYLKMLPYYYFFFLFSSTPNGLFILATFKLFLFIIDSQQFGYVVLWCDCICIYFIWNVLNSFDLKDYDFLQLWKDVSRNVFICVCVPLLFWNFITHTFNTLVFRRSLVLFWIFPPSVFFLHFILVFFYGSVFRVNDLLLFSVLYSVDLIEFIFHFSILSFIFRSSISVSFLCLSQFSSWCLCASRQS